MSYAVWLGADTLTYPQGGGHFWVYLNWALGLRECGCTVVWLEGIDPTLPAYEAIGLAEDLKRRLEPYGLSNAVSLCSRTSEPLAAEVANAFMDVGEARAADLLLNLSYESCAAALRLFRRSALVDIDPGLLQ